ncbi:MAG: hypothetical protein WCF24_04845 [Acidimicrobiales bacterium]
MAGKPELQPLSVFLDDGVVPRSSRDDNYNRLGENISKYLVVKPGDVVFNKLRTWQGGFGVSRYEGIVSPAYFVCRPKSDVEARYLHYLLHSTPYLAELTRVSKFMPPSQFDILWEDLRDLPILLPPTDAQRAIADYLDAETARLDGLIEKKQKMVQLLNQRMTEFAESVIWRDVPATCPLMYQTDPNRPIMYGIVLPGPNVSDGVPIIKGGDVAARRLSPAELNRTTRDIEAHYARARLVKDDLVFAIRGGIGDVEVVPAELTGANMTQDVARIAPAGNVVPQWLRLVLRTPSVTRQVESRITGATVKGLNIWDLKRIHVPMSDCARQRQDLWLLTEAERNVQRQISLLSRQLALFGERRQAVITAAVVGQLEIPEIAA